MRHNLQSAPKNARGSGWVGKGAASQVWAMAAARKKSCGLAGLAAQIAA